MVNNCQAIQHADQTICQRCGLVWDTNDSNPPECLPEPRSEIIANEALTEIYEATKED